MFTIYGAAHTLTQEMIVLCAALGAFLVGMVYLAFDVVRRNRRRAEALNRPIDTSMFQQPQDAPPPEEPAAGMVEAAPPEAMAEAPLMDETMAEAESPAEAIQDEPVYAEAAPEPASVSPIFVSPAFTAPAFATIRPILICDGYGAGFGPKLVLTDMSFAVPDQGITTLMGPNGAGRSTLLRALSGALGQSGLFREWGHAWFRGAPLAAENRPLLVTPRAPLVQRPVLENLMFHLRGRTEHMAEEKQRRWAANWLNQAGAAHLVDQLDQPFMALNPLSQRIVTILREAAAEPALLMLDEPAQGLDEADASTLLTLLQRLAEFTPLFLVLQNQKHARRISDRILLIAGGQVQAACATAEFFGTPPNAAAAQFLETGSCDVPAPDASAIRQLGPIPPVPPLFSTAWAAPVFAPREEEAALAEAAPEEYLPENLTPEALAPEDLPPEAAEDSAPADAPAPIPLTPDDLAAIKDEIRSALAMEMDTGEDTPAEEAPAPASWAVEPLDDLPEPAAWAPDAAETIHEPASEAMAEDETVIPPPESVAEPPHIAEPAEPEFYEAEFLTAPVSFNTAPGGSFTIDIDHDEAPHADEPGPHDELPPINLSASMIQSVPLPPRAASAQMAAPDADPQRYEREAVFRNPGSGGTPGPRGFVWIEEGRLAATPVPGFSGPMEADLDLLKEAGITALITLTEQDFAQNLLARHGLRNVHFPIAEQNAPSTGATDMLVSQMREMLAEGEVLAVHSHASLGRTGTILAAYMVKEQGLSAQAALNQIRRFNQQFVQTDEQEDFLMEYEVQQEQTVLHNRATGHGPKLLR